MKSIKNSYKLLKNIKYVKFSKTAPKEKKATTKKASTTKKTTTRKTTAKKTTKKQGKKKNEE